METKNFTHGLLPSQKTKRYWVAKPAGSGNKMRLQDSAKHLDVYRQWPRIHTRHPISFTVAIIDKADSAVSLL